MELNQPGNERPASAFLNEEATLPAESASPVGQGSLGRAIGFGIGGAFAGCVLYAIVSSAVQSAMARRETVGFFGQIVGLLVIKGMCFVVAFFVGKAVLAGSGGVGGAKYRTAAAVLTYLGVSIAAIFEFAWQMHLQGQNMTHASAGLAGLLLEYGIFSPLLAVLSDVTSGVIGLIILGLAIWYACSLTRRRV